MGAPYGFCAMSDSAERRRIQRVKMLEPLPGRIDGQKVFVLDLSRHGLRVAHQETLGLPGTHRLIEFEWDGRRVLLEGKLTHSDVPRANVRHSGFTIVSTSPGSDEVLREIILWPVERALDEQKANARGVPARAARSFQTGNAREYIRHLYRAGKWLAAKTLDPEQPRDGFTISVSESGREVALLRTAWECGDVAAREVIRKMAELSISRTEGVPTRRYHP